MLETVCQSQRCCRRCFKNGSFIILMLSSSHNRSHMSPPHLIIVDGSDYAGLDWLLLLVRGRHRRLRHNCISRGRHRRPRYIINSLFKIHLLLLLDYYSVFLIHSLLLQMEFSWAQLIIIIMR